VVVLAAANDPCQTPDCSTSSPQATRPDELAASCTPSPLRRMLSRSGPTSGSVSASGDPLVSCKGPGRAIVVGKARSPGNRSGGSRARSPDLRTGPSELHGARGRAERRLWGALPGALWAANLAPEAHNIAQIVLRGLWRSEVTTGR
jgi:hypothetical protein